MAYIVETQTTFPAQYHSQEELTEGLIGYLDGASLNPKVLQRLHQSVSVKGRYLALPMEDYRKLKDFEDRNIAWGECALALGEACIRDLLTKADLEAKDVSALYFTTVTGLAVPSIDARLVNRMHFRQSLKRVPLFGLGCVAGAAGIARVADYLKGHPTEAVILLSVELCSLTIQKGDLSVANMISSGLFGDGVAAVLLVGDEHRLAKRGQPQIIDYESIFFPETEHVMGWNFSNTGFKIVLSADVPGMAQHVLPGPAKAFLKRHGLDIPDIDVWVSHPGGPKVITALEQGLGLPEGTLDISRESLRDIGNLSSASVLAILEKTLATRKPVEGNRGVILAMGPGFCAEVILVQW